MKCGSLFSGVGGFDLGLERAGFSIEWQVEYDRQCQQVLRHHWPEAGLYRDVRSVGAVRHNTDHIKAEPKQPETGRPVPPTSGGSPPTSDSAVPERPSVQQLRPDDGSADVGGAAQQRGPATRLSPVDLICGGFPCQDLSVAGKRAGLDGERSGLWHEFHRIIGELAPQWVLIENVPGLLSSNGGADLAVILYGLEELGYGWSYRVLDSQYFGVPQRRRRVFIIGCAGNQRAAFDALFPVGASLPGDPTPSRETGSRIAASLTRGADSAGKGGYAGRRQKDDVNLVMAHGSANAEILRDKSPTLTLIHDGPPIAFQGGAQQDQFVPPGAVVPTLAHSNNSHGGHHQPKLFSATPRRLTPKECERLQGFPDDWTAVDGMKDGPRYRMMGNAVTVSVAHWIGRRIMEADGK